jgi:hypothetical protein
MRRERTRGTALGIGIALLAALAVPPHAMARSLKGQVSFDGFGAKVHGYQVAVFGTVGTASAGSDTLTIELSKTSGRVTQRHSWDLNLAAGTVKLNRSRPSIVVNQSLGASGGVNFRIGGTLRRGSRECRTHPSLLTGRLRGIIRIRVGDRFFKTITIRRMRVFGQDLPRGFLDCGGNGRSCFSTSRTLFGSSPGDTAIRRLDVDVSTEVVNHKRQTFESFSVDDPSAGTAFSSIRHTLSATVRRSLFTANPALTAATVRAPGGRIRGSMSFAASGEPGTGSDTCRNRTRPLVFQPVQLTAGGVTARFDSIGAIPFGANMGPDAFSLQALKAQ